MAAKPKKKKVIEQRPVPATQLGLQTPEIKAAQKDTEESTSFEEVNNLPDGSGISGMAMAVSRRRFKSDFPNEVLDPTKKVWYKEDRMMSTGYSVFLYTKTHQYKYYANQLPKRDADDYRFKTSLINVLERKKTLDQSSESVTTLGEFFESAMNNYGGLKKNGGYRRLKIKGTNRYLFKRSKV